MTFALSVKNISKQYTLGSEFDHGQSFRELLLGMLTTPFKKFKRLSGTDQTSEKFWALSGVSFDVKPGEIVGIIGRNGAGKSTLLKVLSRITPPTKGHIEFQGRLASLLEVGTGFHPELTGRENIFLNGAILGMSRKQIENKLDDIVAFAEVEKFLDTPVKRYSSGMYVRLAFSVAAHLDPDILVIDEVLAVGDQLFQNKCLGKLKDTAGDGRTVLFVSHNMTVVKSLCTRIIYIQDGEVAFDGAPDQAIAAYLASDKSEQATWHNADNRHLRQVTVGSEHDPQNNLVQFDVPIRVSIEMHDANRSKLLAAVRVTDAYGNALFTSWDEDYLKTDPINSPNTQNLTCIIPGQLLKPGAYIVTVFARFPNEAGQYEFEEANLDLSISGEQCPIPDGRLGLLSPILEWTSSPALTSADQR